VLPSLNSFKQDMLSRTFPVETSFTSEIAPAFGASMSSVVPLKDGSASDLGNDEEDSLPLSSIQPNENYVETQNSTEGFSSASSTASKSRFGNYESSFVHHSKGPSISASRPASSTSKPTAIAALFARQKQKTNTPASGSENVNLDTSRPNKRARGKRIRL